MIVTIIIIAVLVFSIVGIVLYFVTVYNGLITLSRNINKAWANIGVLLKQRHDEIPKLINICEGYMKYERETFEKITTVRTACMQSKGAADSAKKEGELSGLLRHVFAVAENYPDLKANQNFLQLQHRTSYIESQIADRREFYNDSVNSYNIRICQIPDMWVAGMLNMQDKELFNVSEEDKKDLKIKFNFPKTV